MGAAAGLRDGIGHAFLLPERVVYERTEQSLREALGEEALNRAWQAGGATPMQQAVADASRFLDQVLAPVASAKADRREDAFGLTSRELDVLCLLVEGKSDKEIAGALFIGARTVETHVSNLLAKLDAHNRAEAAALAVRHDLV